MLLQTNSYIVPRERRQDHARLVRKFRQVLMRLGCEHFEVYEQVGTNWSPGESTGRYVQIMRFRDRHHQQQVQAAERIDKGAQQVIGAFCELINFPYQQQQGLFATGFYQSVIPVASPRGKNIAMPPTAPVPPSASPSPGNDDPDPATVSDTQPPEDSPQTTGAEGDCPPGLLSIGADQKADNPVGNALDEHAEQEAGEADAGQAIFTTEQIGTADAVETVETVESGDDVETADEVQTDEEVDIIDDEPESADEEVDFDIDSGDDATDDDRYPASR